LLYCDIEGIDNDQRPMHLGYLLEGPARTWFEVQKPTVLHDWDLLKIAFISRYVKKGAQFHECVSKVFDMRQGSKAVEDFLAELEMEKHRCGFSDDLLVSLAIKAVRPEIKTFLLQQDVQDFESLRKAAFVAESSLKPADGQMKEFSTAVLASLKQLSDKVAAIGLESRTVNAVSPEKQQPERSVGGPSRQFRQTPPRPRPAMGNRRPWQPRQETSQRFDRPPQQPQQMARREQQNLNQGGRDWEPRGQGFQGPPRQPNREFCGRCGRNVHGEGMQCPAFNKLCFFCGSSGHLQAVCRSRRTQ
jgi:hypothetical protein